MKTKISSLVNSIHPALVYVAAYLIALTFSIMICVTIFNRFNTSASKKDNMENSSAEKRMNTQTNDTPVAVFIKAK